MHPQYKDTPSMSLTKTACADFACSKPIALTKCSRRRATSSSPTVSGSWRAWTASRARYCKPNSIATRSGAKKRSKRLRPASAYPRPRSTSGTGTSEISSAKHYSPSPFLVMKLMSDWGDHNSPAKQHLCVPKDAHGLKIENFVELNNEAAPVCKPYTFVWNQYYDQILSTHVRNYQKQKVSLPSSLY